MATTQASFSVSREDGEIIRQIADRAVAMARIDRIEYDKMTALMDITACHANGTPLRLAALLKADDFNFAHDIYGIRRFINRETGRVGGNFLPRYAQPQTN